MQFLLLINVFSCICVAFRQVFIERKRVQLSGLPNDDPLAILVPSSTLSNYNNNNTQGEVLQQVVSYKLLNYAD